MTATWELVSEADQRANFVAARDILTCPCPAGAEAATIGRALVLLTDATSAAVFLRTRGGSVTCPWAHNLSDSYIGEVITPDGVNPWIHIMRTPELTCLDMRSRLTTYKPKPWFLRDVCELPRRNTIRRRIEQEDLRSICTWPLSHHGQVIGAVAYYYPGTHVHSASEEEMMRAFISEAAAIASGSSLIRPESEELVGRRAGVAEHTEARALDIARPEAPQTHWTLQLEAEREWPLDIRRVVERPRVARDRFELTSQHPNMPLDHDGRYGEQGRLATWRGELAVEETRLAAERESIKLEQRRLADERAALDEETARLIEMQRRLDAEAARIAAEREKIEIERSRSADMLAGLDAEAAGVHRA